MGDAVSPVGGPRACILHERLQELEQRPLANAPSKRTRSAAPGKAVRNCRTSRRSSPHAPRAAGALRGRSTAANADSIGSASNVTVATTGR